MACIICEQGPDTNTAQQWLKQKHKTTQVVDAQGNPLPGVRVALQGRAEPLHRPHTETTATYTRGPGLFSYLADAQSTQQLVFSKAGYASVAHRVAETLPRQVVLPRERVLAGTVVTADGAAVAGATIGPLEIPDPDESHGDTPPPVVPYLIAQTDVSGRFEVRGLHDTQYRLAARAPGLCSFSIKARPGDALRVLMPADGTSVTGHLAGSRDGHPVPGARIQARCGDLKEYALSDSEGCFSFDCLSRQTWIFSALAAATELPHPVVTIEVGDRRQLSNAVRLTYNQGISVRGTAIDADTSAAIPDLALIIEDPVPQRSQTDPGGRFEFKNVNGLSDISIRYDSHHFAFLENGSISDRVRLHPNSAEDLTTVAIPLHRRAHITGKVIGPDDAPSRSATVFLRRLNGAAMLNGAAQRPTMHRSEPAADGSFAFDVFPAGTYEVSASDAGGVSLPQKVDASITSSVAITLRLMPPRTVHGMVLDADGEPVTGAMVEARLAGEPSAEWSNTERSDGAGQFTLQGLPPRPMKIRARHEEFATVTESGVDGAGPLTAPLYLKFPAGSDFVAEVASADGVPVSDAELTAEYFNAGEVLRAETRTTTEGLARIRSFPAAKLDRLMVSSPTHLGFEAKDIALGHTTTTVKLLRRGNVTLHAADLDGATSAGEAVAILFKRGDADEFTLLCQATVSPSGLARFENQEPGWYKGAVRAGEGYAESDAFELVPEEQKRVELSVMPGSVLDGIITDKGTGAAVQGAMVTIEPKLNAVALLLPRQSTSAASGTFSFPRISNCELLVRVTHPGYPRWSRVVRTGESQQTHVDVRLSSQLVRVHGRTWYANRPIANTLVVLTAKSTQENPYLSTMSRADGSYELSGIPPGEYFLNAEAPVSEDERLGHRSYSLDLKEDSAGQQIDIAFARPVRVKGEVRSIGERISNSTEVVEQVQFVPIFAGGVTQAATLKGQAFEIELEPGDYHAIVADEAPQQVNIPAVYSQPAQIILKR